MISWSIWLARNAHLFEDMIIPTFQCAMQSVSILIHFPQDKKVKTPRDIIPIDTTTNLTFRGGCLPPPKVAFGVGFGIRVALYKIAPNSNNAKSMYF